MSDNLPVLIAFQSYLIDERHFSPYTSRCYGVDLKQYIAFLSDELNITLAPEAEQQAYNRHLKQTVAGGEPSSVTVFQDQGTIGLPPA